MHFAALLMAGAYLLGSVPFAWLIGRTRGIDIRRCGSGNIGATNLARNAGRSWGVLAFVLDFAKGALPVFVVVLWRPAGLDPDVADWLPAAVGAAAVLGHVFPVYLGFRGGKGVATAFGAMSILCWPATLAAAVVWLVGFLLTRTVSVASLAAAVALPVGTFLVGAPFTSGPLEPVLLFASALTLLIVIRHRENIVRLVRGEELRFR